MRDTTIFRVTSGGSNAFLRTQLTLTAVLAVTLLGGCVTRRTSVETVAAIVIVVLAVKLPWLCLGYACLTGLWTGGFGSYSILQSCIFSGTSSPLDMSVQALTPFLVLNRWSS